MYFCTARVIRKAPRRCTFRTVSQSDSLILNSMLSRVTPALLTSTVGPPSSAAIRSTAAVTCSASLTSAPTARAVPPAASIVSTVPLAWPSSRSRTATANPSWASRIAVAAPMPRAAPVTTATRVAALPASLINKIPSFVCRPPTTDPRPTRPGAAPDTLRAHHVDPVEALRRRRRDEPAGGRVQPDQRHAGVAVTGLVALEAELERGVHPDAADPDAGLPGGRDQRRPLLGRRVRVVHDHAAARSQQLGDHPALPGLSPAGARPGPRAGARREPASGGGHGGPSTAALEPDHDDELPGSGRRPVHRRRASRSIMDSRLGLASVVITCATFRTKRSSATTRSIASARSTRAVRRPGPCSSVSE